MSHLLIIVEGETVFDGDVGEWALPPKPDRIPAALRAQLNPNARPAPWMKFMMIAMLGKALTDNVLRDPRLQPLEVDLQTRPSGWTISVDIPDPRSDDIEVISA